MNLGLFDKKRASLIAQLVKNPPAMQETLVRFLDWEDLLEKDRLPTSVFLGFPCGSAGKESTCNAGDLGSISGLGRSPGEGNSYPLQYSCLKNPHGQRSLAGYSPWGRKESDTTERLSTAYSTREENKDKHRACKPSFPMRVTNQGRLRQGKAAW